MSWAEEDWTVGLSGKVLQKVKELQVHHERFSRENKQKQLLLDNLQASLEKQTAKYEAVRVELQSSHRELQRVQEEAQVVVTSKERLSQDLQSKQAQVCSLEGQLDAARTLNNKLTQEVKRLEAELEKLQNSSRTAETPIFSTPCWSSTSPWELSGNKKEGRHGNREEGKTQGLHVRRLQFSDMPSGSLPRQQPRGAHHVQTPDVYSTPSAAFPWERDDTAARRPSPESPRTSYSDAPSQSLVQDSSVSTNGPNESETHSASSELRNRLSDLEEELRVKVQTLNTIQNEVAQSKRELAARELNLQKLRDELSLAHTRMAQEGERASAAEQRGKQLQEELKCQRQNAESSRVQHQQRTKELEKQHQRDLQEFQKERQHMERQHHQEINKLSQELAQARGLHNALQAQLEKVSLQKQAVMKEVDTLKEKLKWTEGQLQQSQKKEAQTQAKLTEAVREAEALTVSLKQSQKKEKALEEDGRRLAEERDHAQCLLRELQEQKAMAPLQQPLPVCSPSQSSSQTFSNSSQHQTRKPSPINAVRQKREEVDRKGEIITPYPTDREPGEGIDSEHIRDNLPVNSDGMRSEESRLQSKRTEVLATEPLQTAAETTPRRFKQATVSEDLKAENASLRSELRDVREELQKRLDDLEVQRRAEAEARTRLKQLSRKNTNQVNEKEEQYKECKAQLEKERTEVDRLKKAVAALETEMMRERQDKTEKKNEDEKNSAAQDKEDEMIELNMQLKKQLSEVKAQLVLEQEERKQLEEEMMNKTMSDVNFKTKIEELEAKIEQLQLTPSKTAKAEEELSASNSPVTYLTLREDELNSNVVDANEEPEILNFCESINERNTMISLASENVIKPEEMALIDQRHSPTPFTDVGEEFLNREKNRNKTSDEQGVCELSVLAEQVQSLQKQNAMEKERANQCQLKLELLQNQVTQQTQQLTMAFERQSQHISGLLIELQEKESTILSTEQELQQCKQELGALKGEKENEDRDKGARGHSHEEMSISVCSKSLATDNINSTARTLRLIPDAESPACSDSVIQEKTLSSQSSETSTELLNLQWENLLLKLKVAALMAPERSGANTNDGVDFLPEEQIPTALSDTGVQTCSNTQQSSVDGREHGEERKEQPEAGSQRLDQISHLQQQVVALQTKLQALSEENHQKTQELALWKLSSESVAGAELQHMAQESSGCVTLMREDEILLSCTSSRLQGRTLFSSLQQNATSEPKTPPFSILRDHNEDNSESDKENTSPTRLNQRNDTKGDGDCSCPARTELKATRSSINRAVAVDVKSVSTQTESLPAPPAPQCTHTRLQEEEEVDSPSVSPLPFGEGRQSKDTVMLTASFPIPADPASLAERIRRNRTQLSAAFDDTEYEPYGLPEVVMKGFADIPTGPSCPYIVRRGLLGTAALPVPQKNSADAEETD